VNNDNFESIAVFSAPKGQANGAPSWLAGRLARHVRVGSRGRDATTSPFDFPRASASYVRAGSSARWHPLQTGNYTGLAMSNVSELAPRDIILKIVADFLARQSVTRTIRPDDNLRDAGLTSMDMVNIVLKVESACGVTIPDREITPANFRSVAAIDSLITSLRRG
jgi:acyl carrier protein